MTVLDNIRVRAYRINLVRFLRANVSEDTGLLGWVRENPDYPTAFPRGIVDTEGSVYRVERSRRRNRIELKTKNHRLFKDINEALRNPKFSPRFYPKRNRVMLAKQEEADRYFRDIRPHNPKHVKRYLSLRENHL